MNDFFELFNIELSPASFTDFLIGLINTVIFSIAVSYIYRKYSNSVSNKVILSNLFPVFAVAIFLIYNVDSMCSSSYAVLRLRLKPLLDLHNHTSISCNQMESRVDQRIP